MSVSYVPFSALYDVLFSVPFREIRRPGFFLEAGKCRFY
jgi:hypothetical protein